MVVNCIVSIIQYCSNLVLWRSSELYFVLKKFVDVVNTEIAMVQIDKIQLRFSNKRPLLEVLRLWFCLETSLKVHLVPFDHENFSSGLFEADYLTVPTSFPKIPCKNAFLPQEARISDVKQCWNVVTQVMTCYNIWDSLTILNGWYQTTIGKDVQLTVWKLLVGSCKKIWYCVPFIFGSQGLNKAVCMTQDQVC